MKLSGKRRLHSVHSLVISLLTTAGLLVDGWQSQDYFFIAATIYWVYQPNIERLEAKLIDLCRKDTSA